MSHRNRGRKLSEWADLVGASLPDAVEEVDDEESRSDARLGTGVRYRVEFRDSLESDFGTDADRDD